MENLSSTLVEWLPRVSWQASILIGLVLIAQWIFGKKLSPAWRYNLWLLVVIRLLLPSSPETSFSIFNATPPLENLAQRLTSLDPRDAASPEHIAHSLPANDSASAGDFSAETLLASQPSQFDFDSWAANVPNATLSRFAAWAAALWFIVAALLLFRAFFQNALFYRKLSLADPITDPTALRLLDTCRAELRLRVRPLLIETDLVPAPAVYGIFRPRILLPPGAANTYSRGELRHIFLHELAHIKRFDPAFNCLLGFARIIHWFNPFVWIAAERMRADREIACDALALRHAGDIQRRQYGETILKILNTIQQPRLRPGLVGIIERKHQLERRITMIAQSQNSSHSLIIATALLVSLAAATLTDAQSPNDADPEPTATLLPSDIRSLSSDDHLANAIQASQTPPRPISENLQIASPPAVLGPFHDYTIQAGNTIGQIVEAYNEEYRKLGMGSITVSDVLRANPGFNPARIRPGQVIKIPATGSSDDNQPVFPGAYEPAAATLTGAQSSDEANSAGSIRSPAPVMSDPAELYTRTFRLDPATLEDSLTAIQPPVPPEIPLHEKLAHLFRVAGVDFLEPIPDPPGPRSPKALYYNVSKGILLVRATLSDLGTIEELLHMLNTTPPQIVLEAKLVEISATDNKALGFDWFLGGVLFSGGENPALEKARWELNELLKRYKEHHPSVISQLAKIRQLEDLKPGTPQAVGVNSDGTPGTVTGILTDPQFRAVVRALEQRSGVKTILAPKVITLSGRETHISIPQEGFLLKTTPTVGADGYSIQLSVDFELTLDKEIGAPPARVASTVVLWDGQSVVLGGIPKEETVTENGQKVTRKKNVLLLITPTIVDPAGNRVNARP